MGSGGLGSGGETGGEEAVDLGMHGFGATAGLALLRVAGEGWEGWERRPGLGAMGGGEGLVVVVVVEGILGLGANGGFFTPVLMTPDWLLSP